MTYRMTVVLEYPNAAAAPAVNARTKAKDLGDGEVVSIQFSDALLELSALEEDATEETKMRAFRAAFDYPGCDDPRRPRVDSIGKHP